MIVCYAIAEPGDWSIVRYVGATHKTLRARLREHASETYNMPKRNWIADVFPVIYPLSYHSHWNEASFAEFDWITAYWGPRIFNNLTRFMPRSSWKHPQIWAKQVAAEAAYLGIADPLNYRLADGMTPKALFVTATRPGLQTAGVFRDAVERVLTGSNVK